MSLFDRINQLTDENALLRTQLHDAQEQAKRDTGTIARQRETGDNLYSQLKLLRADLERLTAEWNKHKALKCTP